MTTELQMHNFDQPIETSVKLEVEQFEAMLVSSQNLIRCDSGEDNTRGLYDPSSKVRYFVHEHDLFVTHPNAHHFDMVDQAITN